MAALENSELNEKVVRIEQTRTTAPKRKIKDVTPKLYKRLAAGNYDPGSDFQIKIPAKMLANKGELTIPVSIDTSKLDEILEERAHANKTKLAEYKRYSKWYDNLNSLVFNKVKPEADACLFLAALAATSARTALDQNILEAAKVFSAVKSDYAKCPDALRILSSYETSQLSDDVQFDLAVKHLREDNSAYAGLLLKKIDYIPTKQGEKKLSNGEWERIENSFSEITVDNAKIPNCNLFVEYYMKNAKNLTRKKLVKDFTGGVLGMGGTKVGSFFLNMLEPTYVWQGNKPLSSATIDTWMIRVFFGDSIEKSITNEVLNQLARTVVLDSNDSELLEGTEPIELDPELEELKNQLVKFLTDTLLKSNRVRSKLILILNDKAEEIGIKAYQLQALVWVIFRKRSVAKTNNPRVETANFIDVIKYTHEVSNEMDTFNPRSPDVVQAIRILSSTPRFFFGSKNIEHNRLSAANRSGYASKTTK
jgi:hypothetical protein